MPCLVTYVMPLPGYRNGVATCMGLLPAGSCFQMMHDGFSHAIYTVAACLHSSGCDTSAAQHDMRLYISGLEAKLAFPAGHRAPVQHRDDCQLQEGQLLGQHRTWQDL